MCESMTAPISNGVGSGLNEPWTFWIQNSMKPPVDRNAAPKHWLVEPAAQYALAPGGLNGLACAADGAESGSVTAAAATTSERTGGRGSEDMRGSPRGAGKPGNVNVAGLSFHTLGWQDSNLRLDLGPYRPQ